MYNLIDVLTLVLAALVLTWLFVVTLVACCGCCYRKHVEDPDTDTPEDPNTPDVEEESLENLTEQEDACTQTLVEEVEDTEDDACYSYSYLTATSDTSSEEDQMVKHMVPPDPTQYIEEETPKDQKDPKGEEKDAFPWLTIGGSSSMFA